MQANHLIFHDETRDKIRRKVNAQVEAVNVTMDLF